MFSWIKRFFCAEQKPEIKGPSPSAGELWRFTPADDPWGAKNYRPVRILDARDGWVRYDMGGVSLFRDERCPVETFVGMYTRVDA